MNTKPEIGSTYEKYVNEDDWHLERRLVLDVTETQVLYEIVFVDPPEGTYVESEPIRKQVSLKDWKTWDGRVVVAPIGS